MLTASLSRHPNGYRAWAVWRVFCEVIALTRRTAVSGLCRKLVDVHCPDGSIDIFDDENHVVFRVPSIHARAADRKPEVAAL